MRDFRGFLLLVSVTLPALAALPLPADEFELVCVEELLLLLIELLLLLFNPFFFDSLLSPFWARFLVAPPLGGAAVELASGEPAPPTSLAKCSSFTV